MLSGPDIGYFPEMSETLPDRIKERLKAVGKSAAAASVEAGQNSGFIGDIFKGKARNPRSDTMAKLAAVLETTPEWLLLGDGAPTPPVMETSPASNVRLASIKLPTRHQMPNDVPVMGTAAGSLGGAFQFEGGVVDYVARPPALATAKDVYSMFIEGTSMMPAHNPGDLRFINPHRPPHIGDTVVITAKYTEDGPYECFIKTLVRRASNKITVEQLNPPATIEFETRFVVSVHKVLTMNELFGV